MGIIIENTAITMECEIPTVEVFAGRIKKTLENHPYLVAEQDGKILGYAYTEVEDEFLNNNSTRFHEHMGYKQVACFNQCAYKFNRWYDLIWMEKMLGEHK